MRKRGGYQGKRNYKRKSPPPEDPKLKDTLKVITKVAKSFEEELERDLPLKYSLMDPRVGAVWSPKHDRWVVKKIDFPTKGTKMVQVSWRNYPGWSGFGFKMKLPFLIRSEYDLKDVEVPDEFVGNLNIRKVWDRGQEVHEMDWEPSGLLQRIVDGSDPEVWVNALKELRRVFRYVQLTYGYREDQEEEE